MLPRSSSYPGATASEWIGVRGTPHRGRAASEWRLWRNTCTLEGDPESANTSGEWPSHSPGNTIVGGYECDRASGGAGEPNRP